MSAVNGAPHRNTAVVVLGGSGFIGRHICAAFAAQGRDVLVVSRRAPGGAGSPYRHRSLDIGAVSAGELARILDGEAADIVVNATGGVWEVSETEMAHSNTTATEHLVAALAATRTRPRLVQLGSVLEYGPVPPGRLVGEHTPARPDSPYGRTKLAATTTVLEAVAAGRLDAVVLRLANAAGAGSPRVSLLGRVAEQLAAAQGTGEEAVITLDPLRARRDYVDARDIADAVVAAAGAAVSGRALAIGRGEAVPVRTLVDLLISVSGIPARVVESGRRAPSRAGVEWLAVDPDGAYRALGWRPRRSMEESVAALWAEVAGRPTARIR
ncbi:NAD-dependent epimerase/dehydratase [Actinoplanes sp. NPDC049548]|uniref:NAD-dependent epimerase/dehydratase family protein n=1 Tax=Actinoplanes sp. NPDC049548 TaxID=3155152 RepID=UPI00343E1D9E